MGTPLGSKYIPYTYMDPLGSTGGLTSPTTRNPGVVLKALSCFDGRTLCVGFRSLEFRSLGFRVCGV